MLSLSETNLAVLAITHYKAKNQRAIRASWQSSPKTSAKHLTYKVIQSCLQHTSHYLKKNSHQKVGYNAKPCKRVFG